jgi:hypothetical protein
MMKNNASIKDERQNWSEMQSSIETHGLPAS